MARANSTPQTCLFNAAAKLTVHSCSVKQPQKKPTSSTQEMQQGLRIGIACAILIFSFIFVIIPPLFFILSKNASSKCTRRLFDLFNMAQGIAGGVLLSNALVHMIPESSYDLRVALVNTYGTAWYTVFPWSLALCGLVIMYMFVADRVLASITFTERCARACPPILTNIVLWFSLCAHSIFLGVALGTQQDDNVCAICTLICVFRCGVFWSPLPCIKCLKPWHLDWY